MTHVAHPAAVPARHGRRFPLCIPILLVWLVLLPFIILLTPVIFVACLALRVNPFRGVAVYWQLFYWLRGVRVAVEDPGAPISIRIF